MTSGRRLRQAWGQAGRGAKLGVGSRGVKLGVGSVGSSWEWAGVGRPVNNETLGPDSGVGGRVEATQFSDI